MLPLGDGLRNPLPAPLSFRPFLRHSFHEENTTDVLSLSHAFFWQINGTEYSEVCGHLIR
jgi:hypothetical protein